mgnify:CR=1 FL=1
MTRLWYNNSSRVSLVTLSYTFTIHLLFVSSREDPCANHLLHDNVRTAFDNHQHATRQPLTLPPPSAPPLPHPTVPRDASMAPSVAPSMASSPVSPDFSAGREDKANNTSTSPPTTTPTDIPKSPDIASPTGPSKLSAPQPTAKTHKKSSPPVQTKKKAPKQTAFPIQPRRSTRTRTMTSRLTVDSTQGKSYSLNLVKGLTSHFADMFAPSEFSLQVHLASKSRANSKATNPDIFTFDQAMTDGDRVPKWLEAMEKEIKQLEEKEVWDIVPISEPLHKKEQIVPSTWTLRYKRAPDGTVKKMKARMCMRGDLQISDEASFSPVVSFATVRLFLAIALTLDWTTCSIDFSNAFVQAELKNPVYMHLPRGFAPDDEHQGVKYCLKLKRSLYGSTFAPRLWYEHLFKFLLADGFKQSEYDKCLLYKNTMMVIVYVDDAGIACKRSDDIDKFIKRLKILEGGRKFPT